MFEIKVRIGLRTDDYRFVIFDKTNFDRFLRVPWMSRELSGIGVLKRERLANPEMGSRSRLHFRLRPIHFLNRGKLAAAVNPCSCLQQALQNCNDWQEKLLADQFQAEQRKLMHGPACDHKRRCSLLVIAFWVTNRGRCSR
jgi:hypothetical protein